MEPRRPKSPVNLWNGFTSEPPPSQVVVRPPPSSKPPPAARSANFNADSASVITGDSHGSSTIKASRTLFSLRGFRSSNKDDRWKPSSDGQSTITPTRANAGPTRSAFDSITGKNKGKAPEPRPQPPVTTELSEAARYLEAQKAHLASSSPSGSQPLAMASSRALEDLMAPLKQRRSHGSDASSIMESEKSKSEDDAQFLQELEAGAASHNASWLSIFGGQEITSMSGPGVVSTSPINRRSGRRGIHRTKSSGSLGSLDGDDESYSNDSGSSDDESPLQDPIRTRPIPAHVQNVSQFSPTFPQSQLHFGSPPHQLSPPDGFPVPDPFASSVPASAFPPDPFASGGSFEFPPNPFGPQPNMSNFGPPPSFGMDPSMFLRPSPHLDTIPSDSEDSRRRMPSPGGYSMSSSPQISRSPAPQPSRSPGATRQTKHDAERTSAGFSRRAPPSKPRHAVGK